MSRWAVASFSRAGLLRLLPLQPPAWCREAPTPPRLARITYPSTKLANVKDLKVANPVAIQYPDKDSPGVIIKLGRKVEGGVGPIADLQRGRGIRFAGEQTFQCPLSPSATENHADPQNGLDTRATSRSVLERKSLKGGDVLALW